MINIVIINTDRCSKMERVLSFLYQLSKDHLILRMKSMRFEIASMLAELYK